MKNANIAKATHSLTIGLCCFLLPAAAIAANGQPLDLATQPLFSSTNAKPNLLFLIDDSGSMDFEVVSRDSANSGTFSGSQPDGSNPAGAGSVKHRDADGDGEADCGFGSGSFYGYLYIAEFGSNNYTDNSNDCNTADDEAWRIRNHNYNPLYYNPAQLYTPWAGVNANGNSFSDIDPTHAPDDPYDPGDYVDLTTEGSNWLGAGKGHSKLTGGLRYYIWNDDGDGVYENGEQTEVRTADLPLSATSYSDTNGDGKIGMGDTMQITTAGHTITIAYPNSQTNLANWFAYYRSRALLAKNAYSKVIAQSNNTRMGLVTIHNNDSVNTPITEMNANPATGNKHQLLSALSNFRPNGGTPLRSAMNKCGNYMSCSGNPFNFGQSCPALSASEGGNCQQNFLIVMTDGFYNKSFRAVGNSDGDDSSDFDGGAYADTYSDTLADIAMRFYEDDIHEDLDDDLITSAADPAPHQHIVTYSVAFGVDGTIDASPTDPTVPFAWPDPGSSDAAKIDDLRHAAYNGRGLFLDAADPSKLQGTLEKAVNDIGQRIGSASALSINTGTISNDSRLFQASFVSSQWTGDLISLPISDGSGNSQCTTFNPGDGSGDDVGDVCAPEWHAAKQLDKQPWNSGDKAREIITRVNGTAAAFRADAFGLDDDSKLAKLIDYIRGDRSNEAANAGDSGNLGFRDRSTLLGDIVNSSPVYVGAPDRVRYPANWTDALNNVENGQEATAGAYRDPTAGNDFVRSYSNRPPMVYVGANDGMLHGFNANTGDEIIAYIPQAVVDLQNNGAKLRQLADSTYGHDFFVDGNPVVGDAVISTGGQPQWRSVLVSGLRGGGKSVFALDVTNPANFSEANAASVELWEFADKDDLGYTYSEPSIVRLHNGKWAAIFGNGYNSANGSAVFYVVDLATGGLIKKLNTQATAGNGNPAYANGLASVFPVDLDGDFIIDYAYAGDLYGNLWKFDLTSTDPNKWKIGFGTTSAPQPLFTACEANTCTANNRQPITVKPQVGMHSFGLDYGVMVYFGTGKYLENGDNTPDTSAQQSFYGIWDLDVFSVDNPNDSNDSPPFSTTVKNGFGRSRLTQQTIVDTLTTDGKDSNDDGDVTDNDDNGDISDDQTYRIVSKNTVQYQQSGDSDSATTSGANKRGWVLDLPTGSGEMVVSDAALRGKIVGFSTLIPSVSNCKPGGSGFFMVVNTATGGRTDFSALDVNGDRMFNDSDTVNSSVDNNATVSGRKISGGAPGKAGFIISRALGLEIAEIPVNNGSITPIDVNVGLFPQGRRTWRELRR